MVTRNSAWSPSEHVLGFGPALCENGILDRLGRRKT